MWNRYPQNWSKFVSIIFSPSNRAVCPWAVLVALSHFRSVDVSTWICEDILLEKKNHNTNNNGKESELVFFTWFSIEALIFALASCVALGEFGGLSLQEKVPLFFSLFGSALSLWKEYCTTNKKISWDDGHHGNSLPFNLYATWWEYHYFYLANWKKRL